MSSVGAALLVWALAPAHVLGLADAVRTARGNQPQLRQQHATTQARFAQSDMARAPLLPTATASLGYTRSGFRSASSIGIASPGGSSMSTADRLAGYNLFNGSVQLNVPIYDFGQTLGSWRSAQALAESQRSTEQSVALQVVLNVRIAFFAARANRALVGVAKDALGNQRRHQMQIEGFVQVGTRPPIDLAQARTDVANANLQRIQAENNYVTSRAQLNQAMGVVRPLDYEVADETLPPVPGEDGSTETLVKRAIAARPELAALVHQQESQKQLIRSARGNYYPSIGASAAMSENGTALDNLQFNWSAGLSLSWVIFQGLQTRAQVRVAMANLDAIDAQTETQAQQVRLDVITAVLGVTGTKAAMGAAIEARTNARERLRLAEGRYATGVGNVIELGDAQTAATQAEAQVIQAEFNLASARARLLAALGER
jgi:outer membrane protein